MFNLTRFGKKPAPAPKPLPEISQPLPGSARPLSGLTVKPNPRPAAEFPAIRPAPNTLIMRSEDGKVHLQRLPQGATLSRPFEPAPAPVHPPTDRVDIAATAWPANNHFTRKLEDLREAHRQALRELDEARMSQPYVSKREKQELSSADLKARKEEVKREAKVSKEQIHGLEKAERQARREVDVFRSRFSKGLATEADFRQNHARVEAARPLPSSQRPLPPLPDEPPAIPLRPPVMPASRVRSASAPDLPTIVERPESRSTDGVSVRSHATRAGSALSQASSGSPPHHKELRRLQEEYRSAKNTYHGMKPEAARHGREAVAGARAEYKAAQKALDDFMKENRGQFELERSGYQGPSLDELRSALRPGMGGDDKYPVFPGRVSATATPASTSRTPSPASSPSPTLPPAAPWQGAQVPRPPADPIARPSAPGPDHPRNRPASPDYGLDYYGI